MLYSKPIITGDENLCTKNEIHINSLKGVGESVQNKSIIKQYYYKVHSSLLQENTNWVLQTIFENYNIDHNGEGIGTIIAYRLTEMTHRGATFLLYKPGSTSDISGTRSYEPVIYNDYTYFIVYYNPALVSADPSFPGYPEDLKELLKIYSGGGDYPIEDIDVLEESSYEEHMEAWNYAVEKFKEEYT